MLVLTTTGMRFANGPLYDDVFVIERAGVIHDAKLAIQAFTHRTMFISVSPPDAVSEVDTYRPIPVLTFFLNAAISGRRLWSYHLLNLVLHLTCVLLLFALIRRWLGPGRIKAATLGAAFFAVHPWLAEAHVWINGRSDPLALAFGLGAALVLLAGGQRMPVARVVSAGVLFFCGLLCKETLLTTLPAFLLLDPKRRLSWRTRALRVAPLFVASLTYLAVRVRVLGGMRTHEDPQSLRTAALRGPTLIFDALYHLIVPIFPFLRSLRDDFATVPGWALGSAFGGLIALAIVVFWARRTWTSGPFAALFFAGALAPIAGISVVLWPGYGRYLYLPAAGFALGIAELGVLIRPRLRGRARALARVATVTYLLVCAGFLVSFTGDMGSDETLYLAAIDRRPTQAYGWGFLGLYYTNTRMDEPGIGALQRAVEIDPSEHRYVARLALVLSTHRRCEEATAVARAGLDRFQDARAAVFHFVIARCAPTIATAASHLRVCLVLRPARTDCESALRELLTSAPSAAETRAALREQATKAPSAAFDQRWAGLLREPGSP